MAGNKPEKTVCVGAIQAPIFANEVEGKKGSFVIRKISVQKRYKDGDEWKSSTSFTADEIPAVIRALQVAYDVMKGTKIRDNGDNSKEAESEEDAPVF